MNIDTHVVLHKMYAHHNVNGTPCCRPSFLKATGMSESPDAKAATTLASRDRGSLPEANRTKRRHPSLGQHTKNSPNKTHRRAPEIAPHATSQQPERPSYLGPPHGPLCNMAIAGRVVRLTRAPSGSAHLGHTVQQFVLISSCSRLLRTAVLDGRLLVAPKQSVKGLTNHGQEASCLRMQHLAVQCVVSPPTRTARRRRQGSGRRQARLDPGRSEPNQETEPFGE